MVVVPVDTASKVGVLREVYFTRLDFVSARVVFKNFSHSYFIKVVQLS